MLIALDIDQTVITHCHPRMDGEDLGAAPWLKLVQDVFGARYRINSMRHGESADLAIAWLEARGVKIEGIGPEDPEGQARDGLSPYKILARLFIEDRTPGIPKRPDGAIDWNRYGLLLLQEFGAKVEQTPNPENLFSVTVPDGAHIFIQTRNEGFVVHSVVDGQVQIECYSADNDAQALAHALWETFPDLIQSKWRGGLHIDHRPEGREIEAEKEQA